MIPLWTPVEVIFQVRHCTALTVFYCFPGNLRVSWRRDIFSSCTSWDLSEIEYSLMMGWLAHSVIDESRLWPFGTVAEPGWLPQANLPLTQPRIGSRKNGLRNWSWRKVNTLSDEVIILKVHWCYWNWRIAEVWKLSPKLKYWMLVSWGFADIMEATYKLQSVWSSFWGIRHSYRVGSSCHNSPVWIRDWFHGKQGQGEVCCWTCDDDAVGLVAACLVTRWMCYAVYVEEC